jgi:hypothetical protein
MVHILPSIAIALLYEPFMSWDSPQCPCVAQVQKAYEAVIGVLHLIPSNLDVSLVVTPLLALCVDLITGMCRAHDFLVHCPPLGEWWRSTFGTRWTVRPSVWR